MTQSERDEIMQTLFDNRKPGPRYHSFLFSDDRLAVFTECWEKAKAWDTLRQQAHISLFWEGEMDKLIPPEPLDPLDQLEKWATLHHDNPHWLALLKAEIARLQKEKGR